MSIQDEQEHLIKAQSGCWEQLFYNTKCQIIMVLVLCAIIGIGTPFLWAVIWNVEPNCCQIESDLRYECFPVSPNYDKNKTSHICSRFKPNCCWDNDTDDQNIQCYYALVSRDFDTKMPGYTLNSDNEEGVNITLMVETKPDFITKFIEKDELQNGPIVAEELEFTIIHYTKDYLSIKIKSKNDTGDYVYPDWYHKEFPMGNITHKDSNAEIFWKPLEKKKKQDKKDSKMFSLVVKRKGSDHIIFNTGEFSPFIFTDQYIEMTTLLPNDLIYGLGQSPSRSFKHNLTLPENWSIFNKYNLNLTTNQTSWFGSHPFYMGWTNDNKAYGVLLVNTFPMQVTTNSRPSLTFRAMGGQLDFRFFLGPTPRDVLNQLYQVIGTPFMPPYWALGFHLCRTEPDLTNARTTIANMQSETIPFDSDCGSAAISSILFNSDLFQEFTRNFSEPNLDEYHINTMIVQVPQKPAEHGISDTINDISDRWKKVDLLRHPVSDVPHVGRFYDWMDSGSGLKNSTVIYPSYMDPEAINQLGKDFEIFSYEKKVRAVFLDYNTPLDLSATTTKDMTKICDYISNYTWNVNYLWDLNKYSPCLNLVHKQLPEGKLIEQMSSHNLYGYQHMSAVKQALEKLNEKSEERTLVMSLSTYIGSGALGGHIGTNMNATWGMLKQSHIQTLEFNMYGIPLTGFPVCGFTGQSPDEELCLRWYQLAALQPFMISHRDFLQNLTDPYSVVPKDRDGNPDSIVLAAIKSAITIRYQLLPYIYSQFYRSVKYLEPVVRPLFYDFPADDKTYRIEGQYMFGDSLMVTPVLKKNTKSSELYFPKEKDGDIWYDYYSGHRMAPNDDQKLNISAIENHINLHIRGGRVIATQPVGNATNTFQSRSKPFELLAALAFNKSEENEEIVGYAEGELFIDDGITHNTTGKEEYLLLRFQVNSTPKKTTIIGTTLNTTKHFGDNISTQFSRLKVYGIIDKVYPELFYVYSDANCTKPMDGMKGIKHLQDEYAGVLTIMNLPFDFSNGEFCMQWLYTDWQKLGLN